MKRILITGATGLIGKRLTASLIKRGEEVTVVSRNIQRAKTETPHAFSYASWDFENPDAIRPLIEDKDSIIHLAGAPVAAHSWSAEYKEEIINSRVLSTRAIVKAMSTITIRPASFICASAVGYYGNTFDAEVNELSPPADDFLGKVCAAWESEATKAEELGVRRVSMRIGIVLSTKDGALQKMLLPFTLGIGGPLGSGKQWFSWIHIEDTVRAFLHALDIPEVHGAVNCCAPNPVRMKEFAKALGKALSRPAFIPVPEFVLKFILGEASEAVLSGQRVRPERLHSSKFVFLFPEVREALKDIIGSHK